MTTYEPVAAAEEEAEEGVKARYLQEPAPGKVPDDDAANEVPPVWMRVGFILGQIFLGTLHVIIVHSSSHNTHAQATDDEEGVAEPAVHVYPYSAVLLILLSETLKLLFSAVAFYFVAAQSRATRDSAVENLKLAASGGVLQYAAPAAVYAIENHIRFAVLKELDSPVTWVVFSHMEIPIVAFMSTFFLGKRLSTIQWISVILLVDGVMASQISICETKIGARCEYLGDFPLTALFMVLLSAFMAASAGTCCEYLFKKRYSQSIHLQNMQLYFWGVLGNCLVMTVVESRRMREGTLFHGLDMQASLILLTMVAQGLCVAAVVKHMSNVAKVYASACGLFVSAIMSAIFSDFQISLPFTLSAIVVVAALYLYHSTSSLLASH